ncbi:MAG: hypothetical protein JNL11_08815 [Bdellovibrionaceae bacterium]|nr:hypothetical protein [Pseudobdellovibrionaceae bacterium]
MSGIAFLLALPFLLTSCFLNNNPLSVGNSDFSESHRPGDPNPPPSVTDLSVSVGSSQAILYWSKTSNTQSYLVKYKKQSDTDFTIADSISTPPYTLLGLEDHITYDFVVDTINRNGQSSSLLVQATPQPYPGTFSLTSITPGNFQVTLNWNLSAGATNYKIKYGTNPSLLDKSISVTSPPSTITDLARGLTYYFTVEGINSSGSTVANNTLSSTIVDTPTAATLLALTPGVNQLTIQWSSAAGANSYDIEYGPSSNNLSSLVTGVSSPYILTGLTNGQIYHVRVVAQNTSGRTPSTNSLSATPNALPTNFAFSGVTSGNGFVDLNWSASTGASEYLVKWGSASNTYTGGAVTSTSTTQRISGLTNGTTYYFSVEAVNEIGRTVITSEGSSTPFKPTVSFASGTQSAAETAGSKIIALNLNQALDHNLSVHLSFSGTAVSGTHFSYTGGSTVIIPAGSTSINLNVSLLHDQLVSGNQTFIVSLVSDSEYFNGGTQSHTLTITDTDSYPIVSLSSTTYTVSEDTPSLTITVQLSTSYAANSTVNYTTTNGTALSGTNYTATTGTLTFNAGQTSKTVSIPILNNDVYNGSRNFSFSLSSPINAVSGTTTSTITISDDDPYTVKVALPSTTEIDICNTVQLNLITHADTTVAARTATTVNLSTGSGGLFYSDNACSLLISSLNFSAGTVQQTVYFKSNVAGVAVLSAIVTASALNMIPGGAGISVIGSRQVSVGNSHACAIGTNGQVYCWGLKLSGRLGDGSGITGWSLTPTAVNYTLPMGVNFSQIVAGSNSSCGLLTNGTVLCWGSNNVGQIGDGTTTTRLSPTPVISLGSEPVSMISGSSYGATFCALIRSYKIKCWGDNVLGQLGIGTISGTASTPGDVALTLPPSVSITSLSVGSSHVCASLSNGTVRCWGSNSMSQLGDGGTTNSGTPITPSVSNVVEVAAGYLNTCVILSNSSVQCWGANGYSSLANGVAGGTTLTPSLIKTDASTTLTGIKKVIPGNSNLIVVTDTNIYMSGLNTRGQFFNFTTVSQNFMTALTGLPAMKLVTLGGGGTVCGVKTSNGQIVCWGDSGHGQAGTSIISNFFGFRPINTGFFTNVSAVGLSDAHGCAVNSGLTYCWGWAQAGRLGTGNGANTVTPSVVKENSNTTNLTTYSGSFGIGSLSQCEITTDNLVKCWGYNTYGQVGAGDTTSYNYARTVKINSTTNLTDVIQISVGGHHVCALTGTRNVYCWGYNNFGQIGQGSTSPAVYSYAVPVSGFSAVVGQRVSSLSSGIYYNCALLENGDVRCWGRNNLGQLGNGTTTDLYAPPTSTATALTGFTQVSTGNESACGIKSNSIYCWGNSAYGQLGVNGVNGGAYSTPQSVSIAEAQSITEVQVYQQTACAIINSSTVTGKAYCWGSNSYGAVGKSIVTSYSTPQVVMQYPAFTTALSGVSKLSVGSNALSACMIMSNGQIQCAGNNTSGQMTDTNNPAFTNYNDVAGVP